MLGRAEKVTVDKENTTIVNGAGELQYCRTCCSDQKQIEVTIQTTTRKTAGTPGQIGWWCCRSYVGAASVEMKERKTALTMH